MEWGVIFDMDGVLVMSEDAHFESWRKPAAARGVEVTHELFLSCFGRVNPDCVRIMFGPGVPRAEAEQIADEKERAYRDIIREQVPLSPGLVPLLQGLTERGARLAVGSSAPPENVDLVLDAGGLRQYFLATVDGTQVKRGKPEPDVFLQAAEKIGVRPERCIVIEDAPPGIRAAKSAGAIAVGVATTHPAEQLRAAGADHVFGGIADITGRGLLKMLG